MKEENIVLERLLWSAVFTACLWGVLHWNNSQPSDVFERHSDSLQSVNSSLHDSF